MKNIIYSLSLLSIVLMLTLTSCSQDAINKLQGEWIVIHVPDNNSTFIETWNFTVDGKLLITNTNPTYGSHNGTYNVEATFLDTKLIISDFPNQYNFYNADWSIIELKGNALYINHDKEGGLFTKEFERP